SLARRGGRNPFDDTRGRGSGPDPRGSDTCGEYRLGSGARFDVSTVLSDLRGARAGGAREGGASWRPQPETLSRQRSRNAPTVRTRSQGGPWSSSWSWPSVWPG